ncbi:hypothetical protein FRY74_02195 [Vicingus serpentipes]|uniref:Glycosyltransferase RgtA/B/C/D-like domain-containing protein n=1 Tax=Vicingus serpentipes TaxID=1926625 RepID=A0A5C6RWS3_9FLAO|nr:hypothetical protein [Vicingus serpentipes]TXB67016.1 hypothetical protein FRY74_02195 [Vicingus serpentipes]
MEITITIFYFILFCFIINKLSFFDDEVITKKWFIGIFTIKVLVSILLTLIYTYYYTDRSTADIFKYFDDSKIMFEAIKTNPIDFVKMLFGIANDTPYFNETYYDNMRFWYSQGSTNLFTDSHTIIRFNAFIHFFSFGYFNVHNVFINFISLLGLTAIFKVAKPYFENNKKLLFFAVFLAPSVLFWGSGLLKESIIFLGVGMLLLHLKQLSVKFNWQSSLIIGLSIVLITYTKLYVLAALTPAFFGYFFYKSVLKQKPILCYLMSAILVLMASFLLLVAPISVNPIELIIAKQHDFITLMAQVENSSSFAYTILQSPIDVILAIPNALVNTLFRPFIWECTSPFMLMSAFENIDIITFFVLAIIFRKKNINYNLLFFCLSFVLFLYILTGLTVPNFGAIARYKVPGLPFLLIAILSIIDIEKLKTKFKFISPFV